jgi:type IV secretory pathway VirB10-like protein
MDPGLLTFLIVFGVVAGLRALVEKAKAAGDEQPLSDIERERRFREALGLPVDDLQPAIPTAPPPQPLRPPQIPPVPPFPVRPPQLPKSTPIPTRPTPRTEPARPRPVFVPEYAEGPLLTREDVARGARSIREAAVAVESVSLAADFSAAAELERSSLLSKPTTAASYKATAMKERNTSATRLKALLRSKSSARDALILSEIFGPPPGLQSSERRS